MRERVRKTGSVRVVGIFMLKRFTFLFKHTRKYFKNCYRNKDELIF